MEVVVLRKKLVDGHAAIASNYDNCYNENAGLWINRNPKGWCFLLKNRVIVMFLCVALLITLNPTAATAAGDYKGASDWAVPELDKASGFGLITDKIKNNMKADISREEFAEIAVRLYEACTGKKAETGNESFSDTTNPEILKAANLKITGGIGGGKFGPDQPVTREQIATFLFRTMKAMDPDGDFSQSADAKFSDDALIDSWAKDGVYYCSKAGIIKGIENNDGSFRFDPDTGSSREVAVIVCTRAYEWFAGSRQPSDNSVVSDEEKLNGNIIILDSEFKEEEYRIREINGDSFIFLPFERFKYVFKMPNSDYRYPDVTLQDGRISVGWKDGKGEIVLQVVMDVGSNKAYTFGETIDITVTPFEEGGIVYVPVNLFIGLFEMQMVTFEGRICFQYPNDFPQEALAGTWSTSEIGLFTRYKDIVTGLVSLPSFDFSYAFNPDGTYRLAMASSGGYEDGFLFQQGKYRVIGNTIIYYDQYETYYKGSPLTLQYENKYMEDRLECSFIDNYKHEEGKIELGLIWYHKLEE
jgi:hypothetical protein